MLVADYKKAGNIMGQFQANVFPASSPSQTTSTLRIPTIKTTSKSVSITPSTTASKETVPVSCLNAFKAAALNQTNFYRARHGVGALTEDSTLGVTSQEWANYLSDNNKFEHNSAKLQTLGYGENIAMYYVPGHPSSLNEATCASINIVWTVLILFHNHSFKFLLKNMQTMRSIVGTMKLKITIFKLVDLQ